MWISKEFERLKDPIVNILGNVDPSKNFVALDIDETVLRPGNVIEPEPTGMFVRQVAETNQLPVVYITAREDTPIVRQITMGDLATVGIYDPLMVVFRPPYVKTWQGISEYKNDARKIVELETQSRCVMNVGDQWTDMMPLGQTMWKGLRNTFKDQYLLFPQTVDDIERWSVKLKE